MFRFVINYLGFLKFIPGLPFLFDSWLKVYTFLSNAALLDWMDEISAEVQQWPDVNSHLHKYGGIQFDLHHKEIGHIHGNGLLDMPFSRQIKAALLNEGYVENHHFFKDTGWISFHIRTKADMHYAIKLLQLGYLWRSYQMSQNSDILHTFGSWKANKRSWIAPLKS
jgi:hypothetical protein